MNDLDDDRAPAAPLRFRKPTIVIALLGYVYDADGPVPWLELVYFFTEGGRPAKTIENVLYELIAYGALHRIGQPGGRRRDDTRALKPTTLGRAWLEQELLPLPTAHDDQKPVNALDEAERIAHDLEEELDLEVPVHDLTPGSEPKTHRPRRPAP